MREGQERPKRAELRPGLTFRQIAFSWGISFEAHMCAAQRLESSSSQSDRFFSLVTYMKNQQFSLAISLTMLGLQSPEIVEICPEACLPVAYTPRKRRILCSFCEKRH